MADQIYIGQYSKGLRSDVTAFNVDNDAFPTLYNFYSWRGRIKRKRGTGLLGRLQRQISLATSPTAWQKPALATVGGVGELIIPFSSFTITNITSNSTGTRDPQPAIITTSIPHDFVVGDLVSISGVIVSKGKNLNLNNLTIEAVTSTTITINVTITTQYKYVSGGLVFSGETSSIAPGTINLTNTATADLYTDPNEDGTLFKNGVLDPGSNINYATGIITFSGAGITTFIGTYDYYPEEPVMGLRDFVPSLPTYTSVSNSQFPLLLAFDVQYSYQINQNSNVTNFYSTSYYKNSPLPLGNLENNPVIWSGQDFEQFWTINYSGALWATNNNPGFNFVKGSVIGTLTGTTILFNFTSAGLNYTSLVVGDVLWFNEWPAAPASTINQVTGVVSINSGAAAGNYTVTFSTSVTVTGVGITQLLTNYIEGQDGIRWYDGDPTSTTGLPTVPPQPFGWVNFSPPLTATSVSIDSTTPALYYLVGALAILPFKDRLLFFSPFIQTSSGAPILLQDTVLWSWNGTPYYTVDASGNPFLVPIGETANPKAYYVDQTGLGDYLPAGVTLPIITVNSNEDAIIIGFGGNGGKKRFVYTGNDLEAFLFFNITNDMPSMSTFSAINFDSGVIDIGQYGITLTDQQSCERIDLEIPDEVFKIQNENNGPQRVNAIRDYFKEWIYFSYPVNNSQIRESSDQINIVYPTQTFLYNYRDDTWAILYENFTTHGRYRAQNKKSWTTLIYKSWETWREPWNSGVNSVLMAQIIAGNPQGFVLIRSEGTGEAPSGTIAGIINAGNGYTQINSASHCVTSNNPITGFGDYLYFLSALGTTWINGQIGKVINIIDEDNFVVDILFQAGTYLGLGTFTRLSQPLLQTKQFPFYWEQGRKTRLSVQKYLLEKTQSSQVTLDIYLSQNADDVWNNPIVSGIPNGLIYSQILFTCPESTNLGLTPANVNLQMSTGVAQNQIWHRYNQSLIGDSIQIGITLNDLQMRNISYATDEIVLHGIQLTFEPGPMVS
jgi:hypothetical protein